MFHIMRNNAKRGTQFKRTLVEILRQRLPPGWSVELRPGERHEEQLSLKASDGRQASLTLISRSVLSPKDVSYLVRQAPPATLLLSAPFLSPRTRELIANAGASYADATGNLRVVTADPAVFVGSQGADRDPDRQPRPLRSLKGAAAARVVRALCDFEPPFGVRTLAECSVTPLGTVSRVVSFLEEEALLTRDQKKVVTAVDWPALIKRWVTDYSVTGSNAMSSHLEPRGLVALASSLRTLGRYAVTGSLAATGVVAPARLAMVYVENAEKAAQTLELVPTETGANVWLLEPYDEVVFERTQTKPFGAAQPPVSIIAAASSQVVADLMTSPGRGPQEAEALIEKMKGSEHAWRQSARP
jgi:hypothetical protein